MKKATIAAGAVATVLVLALAVGYLTLRGDADPAPASVPAIAPLTPVEAAAQEALAAAHPGFLYGRVTTHDGATYEGRLRWGGGQEAFWGDYFNGAKEENPWAALVPVERLPKERRPRDRRAGTPDRPRPALHGALR
jgi:hypothetical protein